jgi:hypothetical protein
MPLNLQDALVITFVGWPAIITSIIFWVYGLVVKKFKWIVAAGVLFLPFSILYLGQAFQSDYLFTALAAICQFGSAFSLNKNKLWIAWLLFLPILFLISMMAYSVIFQQSGIR